MAQPYRNLFGEEVDPPNTEVPLPKVHFSHPLSRGTLVGLYVNSRPVFGTIIQHELEDEAYVYLVEPADLVSPGCVFRRQDEVYELSDEEE